MPNIRIFTVDAFTDQIFRGNTCAICIFHEWPEGRVLQNIAAQNLFAETAFIVQHENANPELRWFTVSQEVDFCGYGTLSAGYVYLTYIAPSQTEVTFATRRYGPLQVKNDNGFFQIEVPVKPPLKEIFDDAVCAALGGPRPETMITSARDDLLIIYKNEADVRSVAPDFADLMDNPYYGFVLTSPGDKAHYAYRYFSPRMINVWEDPVNGASQSVLAPYWAERLGQAKLHGQAVSRRGGDVYCEYSGGDTVRIGGRVTTYLQGEIQLTFL
jgi:PhzF family phenazine biosynthesis protein